MFSSAISSRLRQSLPQASGIISASKINTSPVFLLRQRPFSQIIRPLQPTWPSRRFSTSANADDDFSTPYAELIEEGKKQDLIERQKINTRGIYREQLCRTPFMKVSAKRLNMIGHLIKGMEVEKAILQLMFLKRDHCEPIIWALQEGCRIAKDIQGFEDPRNFYVAWAYVCRGKYTKKIDIKGRGRYGRIRSPETHLVLMLRDKQAQIDFQNRVREKPKKVLFQRVLNPRIQL